MAAYEVPRHGVAVGLPEEPSATARYTFLEALNDIDRRVVDGKDDGTVGRGLNQCGSIKNAGDDEEK